MAAARRMIPFQMGGNANWNCSKTIKFSNEVLCAAATDLSQNANQFPRQAKTASALNEFGQFPSANGSR
jgi:hypothetical protein